MREMFCFIFFAFVFNLGIFFYDTVLYSLFLSLYCKLYILWYAVVTSVVCWCIFLFCSSCVEFIMTKKKPQENQSQLCIHSVFISKFPAIYQSCLGFIWRDHSCCCVFFIIITTNWATFALKFAVCAFLEAWGSWNASPPLNIISKIFTLQTRSEGLSEIKLLLM